MPEESKPKFIYIVHPIGGDIEGNKKKVLDICSQIHTEKVFPLVPYIVSCMYLDDTVQEERTKGMLVNKTVLESGIIDEAWVYGDRISAGMRYDIRICCKKGIRLRVKNNGKSKEEHVNFIREFQKVYHEIKEEVKDGR